MAEPYWLNFCIFCPIVRALDPGTFIPDRKAFGFEEELQEVAGAIEEIMDTDPHHHFWFESFQILSKCTQSAMDEDSEDNLRCPEENASIAGQTKSIFPTETSGFQLLFHGQRLS